MPEAKVYLHSCLQISLTVLSMNETNQNPAGSEGLEKFWLVFKSLSPERRGGYRKITVGLSAVLKKYIWVRHDGSYL
jgi:hypothetical protein